MKIKDGKDLVKRLNADDLFGLDVEQMISDYQKLEGHEEFSIPTFKTVFNALLLSPHGRFVEFTLGFTQLPLEIFELFTSATWPFLSTINIMQSPIGDKGSLALSKCSLPQIKNMTLDMCGITDEGAYFISQAEWPTLENLTIWRNQISIKGFQNLAKGKWLRLETLDFGNIEDMTKDAQEEIHFELQEGFNFGSLKSLRIGNCDALGKICAINNSNMTHLQSLNILSSPVCPLEVFDSSKNTNWDSLKQLTIGSRRHESSMVQNVLQSICTYHFSNLKMVNIIYNQFTKKAVRQLAKTSWPFLSSLRLVTFNQQFDFGVEMMKIVSKCEWKQLTYFETQLKNVNTVEPLREADCPNLKEIYLVNAEQTKLNIFATFYLPKQRIFFKKAQTFYNPEVTQTGYVVSWADQLPFLPI